MYNARLSLPCREPSGKYECPNKNVRTTVIITIVIYDRAPMTNVIFYDPKEWIEKKKKKMLLKKKKTHVPIV